MSAAVSLKEAITDVARSFEAETARSALDLVFGSSGQLATQIRSGAPVDLFISAANKEVDDLSKVWGWWTTPPRKIVAGNRN